MNKPKVNQKQTIENSFGFRPSGFRKEDRSFVKTTVFRPKIRVTQHKG